jgi:hypothetical protein
MEQPVEFDDVLQGEQAKAISLAVEALDFQRFGKQVNGNVNKKGIVRSLPDNSKISITREVDDAKAPEIVVSHSVFVRNSEAEVIDRGSHKKMEPREEWVVVKIVFSDGRITRLRKGIDIVDSKGCIEPKKGSEDSLSESDLSVVGNAVSLLGKTLEKEKPEVRPPSKRRRIFQAIINNLPGV